MILVKLINGTGFRPGEDYPNDYRLRFVHDERGLYYKGKIIVKGPYTNDWHDIARVVRNKYPSIRRKRMYPREEKLFTIDEEDLAMLLLEFAGE